MPNLVLNTPPKVMKERLTFRESKDGLLPAGSESDGVIPGSKIIDVMKIRVYSKPGFQRHPTFETTVPISQHV